MRAMRLWNMSCRLNRFRELIHSPLTVFESRAPLGKSDKQSTNTLSRRLQPMLHRRYVSTLSGIKDNALCMLHCGTVAGRGEYARETDSLIQIV
ncbi:hypothetical protein BAUCODRAFT_222955 [Baudoinia panamericana UAMH 10762]|uniref:Uncharacterized protein n=1 Tax=Baudoinia panamericana (strain UAMH 10762) TaxID=717646 RepID=M2MRQ3_BAUPA|nr:uncharacterized protein BAUCODRAFT_222955 [Baudoinia panamericana UAMH 10762]EMC94168.1 hypothetical protein BAUCODRAFT_222955 [Baudoinia panamericana UAMH 10762]